LCAQRSTATTGLTGANHCGARSVNQHMSRLRYGLRSWFKAAVFCCASAALVRWLGAPLALLVVLSLSTAFMAGRGWFHTYRFAPALCKHVTILVMMGLFSFSLLCCWLVQTRDDARRNLSLYRLWHMGQQTSQFRELFPNDPILRSFNSTTADSFMDTGDQFQPKFNER